MRLQVLRLISNNQITYQTKLEPMVSEQ